MFVESFIAANKIDVPLNSVENSDTRQSLTKQLRDGIE